MVTTVNFYMTEAEVVMEMEMEMDITVDITMDTTMDPLHVRLENRHFF